MHNSTMTNTMETTAEIYRNNRPLAGEFYIQNKFGTRAKVIIVRAEKDFEGIAVYEDGSSVMMWGNNKARVTTAIKRAAKNKLDNR